MTSDAPSRPTLSASPSIERPTASRRARTYGLRRETIAGARVNVLTIRSRGSRGSGRGSRPGPGRAGSGCRRPCARVRDLVERVAALDAGDVDRGPVEHVRRLAAERQGLDAPERVVRLEDRVVAEPRGRAVGGRPGHLDPGREHALRLHADVEVGRLAGQREVRAQALGDQGVGRAVVDVLGLLVGDAQERHPDLVLLGRLADGAHDRRERALHVVGAAADEAVALDARLELALAGGHDVKVAVEDHGRPLAGADVGHDDREAVEVALAHLDVARLEPALDERGRRAQRLGLRRVVPHEALCEDPLIHVPEDRVGP